MSKTGSKAAAPNLFPHPFSKEYWIAAVGEFRKTRVLVFAALMIALRLILKTVSIPIGPDLRINTAFFINAYGAMVFGPVVAIVSAAITDTLGCILFPTGAYFFPFIFIEIAGSLIFALFLYRAQVSTTRVILSRFCICFFVNIVLNTPIMMIYYHFVMGKYYRIFDLPRIVKNLALFPLESIALIFFLRLVIPQTKRLGFVYSDVEKLHMTKNNKITLASLFVLGVVMVCGYSLYSYNNTSLTKGYAPEERLEKNMSMIELVREQHDELAEQEVVTIIESAYPKFMDPNVTYSVAVYVVNEEEFEANAADRLAKDPESTYSKDTLNGYSKSKAKKDSSLESLGLATIVLDKKSGEVVSYTDTLE